MMEHKLGNRLLASLPPADFDLLAPHFRKVRLNAAMSWCGREIELSTSTSPQRRNFVHAGHAGWTNSCDER